MHVVVPCGHRTVISGPLRFLEVATPCVGCSCTSGVGRCSTHPLFITLVRCSFPSLRLGVGHCWETSSFPYGLTGYVLAFPVPRPRAVKFSLRCTLGVGRCWETSSFPYGLAGYVLAFPVLRPCAVKCILLGLWGLGVGSGVVIEAAGSWHAHDCDMPPSPPRFL